MSQSAASRFKILKQGELSYAILLDGEHIEEFTDLESAKSYVEWFTGLLDKAWSSALERAAQLAEGYAYTRSFEPGDLAAAIRALAEAEQ